MVKLMQGVRKLLREILNATGVIDKELLKTDDTDLGV